MSDAKASHPQRMWAEISSSAPHLLHQWWANFFRSGPKKNGGP